MAKIFRTPAALEDLVQIGSYIAERAQSRSVAERFLDTIDQRCQLLAQNPLMGELQPQLADGEYRRVRHGQYVIYYRPISEGIVLVRVLHAARKHEDLL